MAGTRLTCHGIELATDWAFVGRAPEDSELVGRPQSFQASAKVDSANLKAALATAGAPAHSEPQCRQCPHPIPNRRSVEPHRRQRCGGFLPTPLLSAHPCAGAEPAPGASLHVDQHPELLLHSIPDGVYDRIHHSQVRPHCGVCVWAAALAIAVLDGGSGGGALYARERVDGGLRDDTARDGKLCG